MQIERRTVRSNTPQEALTLALAAAARRSGAKAAVIADDDGLLVAGTGEGFDHSWVAAFAPVDVDLLRHRRDDVLRVTRGHELFAAPIWVSGKVLFFAAVGGSAADVRGIEAAADRILAS
jgi:hypothetical protein